MKFDEWEIVIANILENDELIAEIYFEGEQFAEVTEKGQIKICSSVKKPYWHFSIDDLIIMLGKAQKELKPKDL
jgi:hypothetical protein